MYGSSADQLDALRRKRLLEQQARWVDSYEDWPRPPGVFCQASIEVVSIKEERQQREPVREANVGAAAISKLENVALDHLRVG